MEAATAIQQSPNLTAKEKQIEMINLMYTDTTRFKYNSIKRIRIPRTDRKSKVLRKVGRTLYGVGIAYTFISVALITKNKNMSPYHSIAASGMLIVGYSFILSGTRKMIYTKKWQLKGN